MHKPSKSMFFLYSPGTRKRFDQLRSIHCNVNSSSISIWLTTTPFVPAAHMPISAKDAGYSYLQQFMSLTLLFVNSLAISICFGCIQAVVVFICGYLTRMPWNWQMTSARHLLDGWLWYRGGRKPVRNLTFALLHGRYLRLCSELCLIYVSFHGSLTQPPGRLWSVWDWSFLN